MAQSVNMTRYVMTVALVVVVLVAMGVVSRKACACVTVPQRGGGCEHACCAAARETAQSPAKADCCGASEGFADTFGPGTDLPGYRETPVSPATPCTCTPSQPLVCVPAVPARTTSPELGCSAMSGHFLAAGQGEPFSAGISHSESLSSPHLKRHELICVWRC